MFGAKPSPSERPVESGAADVDGKLMAVPVKAGSSFEAGIPVTLFDTTFDVTPDDQPFLISRFRMPCHCRQ
jgi:hypothetical protein